MKIKIQIKNPTKPAGIIDTIIIKVKWKFSSFLNLIVLSKIFFTSSQKYINALNAVARCSINVKKSPFWASNDKPKISLKISMWPLEETGKNSVKPCTIPRMKDLIISKLFRFC